MLKFTEISKCKKNCYLLSSSLVSNQHTADWCSLRLQKSRQYRTHPLVENYKPTENILTWRITWSMTKRMQCRSSWGVLTWWRSSCLTWMSDRLSTWHSQGSAASCTISSAPPLSGTSLSRGPFLVTTRFRTWLVGNIGTECVSLFRRRGSKSWTSSTFWKWWRM